MKVIFHVCQDAARNASVKVGGRCGVRELAVAIAHQLPSLKQGSRRHLWSAETHSYHTHCNEKFV